MAYNNFNEQETQEYVARLLADHMPRLLSAIQPEYLHGDVVYSSLDDFALDFGTFFPWFPQPYEAVARALRETEGYADFVAAAVGHFGPEAEYELRLTDEFIAENAA